MRFALKAIVLTVLSSLSGVCPGQTAASPKPAVAAPTAQPATAPQTALAVKPSAILQTSLDGLQTTLTGLRPEKWKSGTVRSEAATNIASLQKDLQETLPVLLAAADAAPQSMSKALPVTRNLDALYDVLLRVVDGARVAAPADQVDQLIQAMASVEKSRLALNDHLQEMAAGQEKQVIDLQAAVVKAQSQTPPAPVCPKPPPSTPAPAAKKRVAKKKPATPATTPPATQTPAPAAKPNSQ
jgi:hypothetical protein